MGILEDKEVELRNEDPPIRGFVDVVVNMEGARAVGEIKTIKHEQFIKRKDQGVPSESHLVQLLIYMKLLDINEGFVFYEDKNDGQTTGNPIVMNEKNQEYVDYIFDWMRQVYSAYKEGKNVSKGYPKSSTTCKYCPINKACHEAKNGRTKIPPLEAKIP